MNRIELKSNGVTLRATSEHMGVLKGISSTEHILFEIITDKKAVLIFAEESLQRSVYEIKLLFQCSTTTTTTTTTIHSDAF